MKYDIEKDIKFLEKNGIIMGQWCDVDDDFYHNSPGISASGLKQIDKECPETYKHAKDAGPQEKTEALIVGNAIHKFILENDDFEDEFLFAPVDKKTDRKWKIFANEHKEDPQIILRAKDGEMLNGILTSLRRPKDTSGTNTYDGIVINKNTTREKAIYVVDHERNIIIKVKVDINMDGMFLDLKSTKNAKPDIFMKDAANLGYGIQAAFYINTARMAGEKANMFGFIAVEKEAPYMHSVIILEDNDIQLEMSKVNRLLDVYAWCLNNDNWYGYNGVDQASGAQPLFVVKAMPSWHRYALEEANNFEGN